MFLIFLLVFAAIYAFFAICLMKIAQKTNTDNAWWAWIPILQIILLLNVAHKPVWWIILLFVPLVNIVISILVFIGVAEARGKGAIWGIIAAFIPIIGLPYLAFSE
ncbi:MAG: signal peptidase I [Acidobacteria bacterium]|nr:signal peptidase I [Acidobacteriota bacterium]